MQDMFMFFSKMSNFELKSCKDKMQYLYGIVNPLIYPGLRLDLHQLIVMIDQIIEERRGKEYDK